MCWCVVIKNHKVIVTVTLKIIFFYKSVNVPEIETIIVERDFDSDLACGTKGVGELATIPTAPATQGAYYMFDGRFRNTLPMEKTPYRETFVSRPLIDPNK